MKYEINSSWRTRSVEDFLRTVYILQQASAFVATTRIAKSLSIAPSSVVGMIDRLVVRNDIQYPKGNVPPTPMLEHRHYRGIRLTADGEKVALQVIRRRYLIEVYLVQMLDYRWDEVEAEADRLEHDMSGQLTERIAFILGNPEVSVYGEPIPTSQGNISIPVDINLTEMESGKGGTVSRVIDRSPELLRLLAELGLLPGAKLNVLSYVPLTDSMIVEIDRPRSSYVLSTLVARHVHLTNITTIVPK